MLDATLRPLIDPPLNVGGRWLAAHDISADAVTLAGLAVSVSAAVAIAMGSFGVGLGLIVLSRLLDGLDGPVSRATTPTAAGGFLDSVCDYVFYAAVPLAFAIAEPATNALPAAAVLASFLLTCSSFLAYAALAAARGMTTTVRGRKAFFYAGGLIEGTETIAFFVAMVLLPHWFAPLAWTCAALCVLTALARSAEALREFR